MSNKRVTELSALTSSSLDSKDIFMIVDRSFSETKRIEMGDIVGYLEKNLKPQNCSSAGSSESSELAITAETASVASFSQTALNSTSASYSEKSDNSLVGGIDGKPFQLFSYTQTQIDNFTDIKLGTIVYNQTSGSFQGYTNSGWKTISML